MSAAEAFVGCSGSHCGRIEAQGMSQICSSSAKTIRMMPSFSCEKTHFKVCEDPVDGWGDALQAEMRSRLGPKTETKIERDTR